MLFFHKTDNVYSLSFNFEVRITKHFARISFTACNQRILKRRTRERWTRNVQTPRLFIYFIEYHTQWYTNND